MKRITCKPTIQLGGSEWEIHTLPTSGCYIEMLARTHDQMAAMLSHHSRVLVVRFELRVNEYSEANELVSNFFRKLKKKLAAQYGLLRIGHLWAREMVHAKQQHYHACIMLDGNKVLGPQHVLDLCEHIWSGWGQPKVFVPKNCYYRIGRGDAEAFGQAFWRLSYLCKAAGKGHKAPGANDYSLSRIKPRIADPMTPTQSTPSDDLTPSGPSRSTEESRKTSGETPKHHRSHCWRRPLSERTCGPTSTHSQR